MDTGDNAPTIDPVEILEGVVRWVSIESPSHDGEAVNRVADQVESELRALPLTIKRLPGKDGYGDILTARTEWGGDGPGILVLSHIDTVHRIGTLADVNPIRQEDDKVYGPGIYDMKAGAHIALYALRHLVRSGKRTPLPVTFMFVPEEEIGSPTSRAAIEAAARANHYALVTEPARDGGKIVTARKGAARFKVRTLGKAAHAGLRHEDGRSAIAAMAKVILELEAMTDYARGITVNVGVIGGGTGANVVPAECAIDVDIRVPTPQIGEEMCTRVTALASDDEDVQIEVAGGINRPPYEKDAGITALFEHARSLAAEIGFELQDVKTGGGSDGNFTAALGVPTLDGLGADGYGAHADYEHIYYSSLVPRTELWVRLLETLEAPR